MRKRLDFYKFLKLHIYIYIYIYIYIKAVRSAWYTAYTCIFAERTEDEAERARRAREDAAEDAKLDSGPRGLFFSVMVSVCLSVCLRARVLRKVLGSARSVTSAESGAIEAPRRPRRRAKGGGEFFGAAGMEKLRGFASDRPPRP